MFDVGDVDGDGANVVGVTDAYAFGAAAGAVVIPSGSDGSSLLELSAPTGARFFGLGVGRVADVDGDGREELAVAAVTTNNAAAWVVTLHLHSVTNGKRIAVASKADV